MINTIRKLCPECTESYNQFTFECLNRSKLGTEIMKYFICIGSTNVRTSCCGVCSLLAAISRLLRVGLPSPVAGISTVRSAHLPCILLARNG